MELRPFRVGDPDIEPLIDLVREANIVQFNAPAFVAELVSWIRFSQREVSDRQDGLAATALGFPAVPRWLGSRRKNDQRHWVDVGRSFERVALTATSLGIAHAHVNMPCEVEPIRRRLAARLGLNAGEQPLLLIRLGYAKQRLPASPRRSVDQVMRRP